jgi:protein dithiol:quinone oxidoreductase
MPNPFAWSYRVQYLFGALACAALLGYALYVEHGMFMMPCPLCILQRVAFLGMGVFFLLGAITGPRPRGWRRLVSTGVALFAAAGVFLAVWHLRLQNLPPGEVPSCSSMELGYMLKAFPLQQVIQKVFTGSGECAVVDWTFLGLAMPAWTLLCYLALGGAALWAGWRQRD